MNSTIIYSMWTIPQKNLRFYFVISAIFMMGYGCDPSSDSDQAGPYDHSEHSDPSDPSDPAEPENIYQEWFADFNDGQGTAYLDQTGVVYEDGDMDRYADAVEHTFIENISYGPFSRNVFDLYLPKNVTGPTPVALYLHGGGFSSGDKDNIHGGKADIHEYLRQGIAVASANYRYGSGSPQAAMSAERPNGVCDGTDGGCRKDYVFRDGARVIQYLRYASDLHNIDPERIGLWGSSAGGQIALWIATVPDLAMTDHPDPVLQQSTRVRAVGHSTSQVSALLSDWPALLDFSDNLWESLGWYDESVDKGLQGIEAELSESEEGQVLLQIVDYYSAISADDPPIITAGSVNDHSEEALLDPENADDAQRWLVHHPQHSTPIYERCRSVKDECEIATVLQVEGEHVEDTLSNHENVQAFLTHWLTASP